MAGVTKAQTNHDTHTTTPITPTGTQNRGVSEFPECFTMEELATQFHILQAQMAWFTAPTTHNAGTANMQHLVLPSLTCAPNSVPKPKGSAGGGQRGYHLKVAMGLTGHKGAKKYNMILATVRELVHAAQLDHSCHYHCVSAKDLSKIFMLARCIHSYLERFESDCATAAIYFRQPDDNHNSNVM
ncbi:hypothetical protein BC835DRAFT_1310069 [Cytidiella melzeri]|nr:hypothetical protein BC835DRAFT_1310069 [Cytidiella melzeri]